MLQAATFFVAAVLGGTLAYIAVRCGGSEKLNIKDSGNGDELETGGGNQLETGGGNQLIPVIGRELSIECLLHCSRSTYGSIAMLNQNFRSLIKSGFLYKLRRNMGIIESWIYFSREIPNWEAFDPERRRWIRVPKLKIADHCFICSDKESQAVGTQLLVFGKGVCEQIVCKYDLLSNSWSSGMKLRHPRRLFASASLGEIAVFAGGSDIEDGNVVGFVEMYRSDAGTWHELPDLIIPRKRAAGFFLDGMFWVVGGVEDDSSSDIITIAEGYDFTAKKWTIIRDMSPPQIIGSSYTRTSTPLLAVVENELYAAYHDGMELWKYKKGYNFWHKIGLLPARVSSLRGWGIAFRGCGNWLLIIGGPRSYNGGGLEIYGWEPREGCVPEWTLLAMKPFGNFVFSCSVMGC